jgi:hypothetical protein
MTGVLLMMLGAVLLVYVYLPLINPPLYRIDSQRDRIASQQKTAPIGRYICGTPASLVILRGAWHFNRRAQRVKQEEQCGKP